jgi:hypothetical protein
MFISPNLPTFIVGFYFYTAISSNGGAADRQDGAKRHFAYRLRIYDAHELTGEDLNLEMPFLVKASRLG